MKQRQIDAYVKVAEVFSELSYANKLKVGCIIVKDNRIISIGYNGTPAGWDNECENKEYCLSKDFNGNYFPGTEDVYPFEDEIGKYRIKTKPEVLHAEENAILKLASSRENGMGAILFGTHSPCINCARMIYGAGIVRVYYKNDYRNSDGIDFLQKCGITVCKYG